MGKGGEGEACSIIIAIVLAMFLLVPSFMWFIWGGIITDRASSWKDTGTCRAEEFWYTIVHRALHDQCCVWQVDAVLSVHGNSSLPSHSLAHQNCGLQQSSSNPATSPVADGAICRSHSRRVDNRLYHICDCAVGDPTHPGITRQWCINSGLHSNNDC